MYSKAELFALAQVQTKPIFVTSVTTSTPEDAPGCIDLDAEADRLNRFWDVARMSVADLVAATGMRKTAFAKGAGIPLRTLQNWCYETRDCPVYLRFLLSEHYNLI